MKQSLIVVLFFGLMAGGWWLWHPRHPRQENMEKFESAVTEALLRGIMQEMDADKPMYYYVGFGPERTDPSRLFMARFATHVPPVRGISSAYVLRNGQWLETATARTGVIIQIIRLQNFKPGTGEAIVRFPKLPAGQNQLRYRMMQEGEQWSIKYHVPDNQP